jgi:alpha-tubulin suppressor-like RCC1 family protein
MPPAPAGATNVVLVSDSGAHALALRADGTLAAWGHDEFGQGEVPSGLSNAVAIVAAGDLSMVLKADGTVGEWGYGGPSGSGADGTYVPEAAALTNAVAISAEGPCAALRTDHTVAAWVANPDPPYWSWDFGPLDICWTFTNNVPPFTHQTCSNSPPDLTNAVAVAAGPAHCLALRSDGSVVAWGWAVEGQTNIPPGLSNVVAISTGDYFCLALRSDGTVAAWGCGLYGNTNVPPDLTNAVAIAMGSKHGLALRSDGTVVGWGDDSYGQIDIPPGLTNVVSIAAGGYSSMAVIGAALPPSQVALTNFSLGAGGFTVQVPTDRGRVYELEYKNSLTDTQWQLLPLAAGTGGLVSLTDPAAGAGQRFYRVRRW